MISLSVMSDSLQSHGLQPARLLCSWGFSRQEYWSGLSCPPPEDLPNLEIKPRFPALQVDSLPSEPPGKLTTYHQITTLVVQTVKKLPAMWETWVRSLGCEDPLEEGMVIQSSILSWRFHTNLGAWWTTVHSVARNRT